MRIVPWKLATCCIDLYFKEDKSRGQVYALLYEILIIARVFAFLGHKTNFFPRFFITSHFIKPCPSIEERNADEDEKNH